MCLIYECVYVYELWLKHLNKKSILICLWKSHSLYLFSKRISLDLLKEYEEINKINNSWKR